MVDTNLTLISYILLLTQLILKKVTQGPDTVIVPRSFFHDSSDGQNRETCLTSDPSVVYPSNPKSHGQSQDVETTTDLSHNDTHSCQARTLRLHMNLCNNQHRGTVTTLQRIRSTILPPKISLKTNPAFVEAVNTTYAPILIVLTQKFTDIDVSQILFSTVSVRNLHSLLFFFPFLLRTHSFSVFGGKFIKILNINKSNITLSNKK